MNKLSLFCYKNYSDLLQSLEQIDASVPLIEVGATHCGRYVLICEGSVTLRGLPEVDEVVQIEQPHPGLLAAYFKQKPVRVEKNFVCIESNKLAVLFEVTQMILMQSNFECIEIQRSIHERGNGYALFCNGDDLNIFKRVSQAHVVIIEKPSATIKNYY